MLVKDRREWVSWCAVVLVLAAYVAVSNGVIAPKGAPYQILNILGAGLFLVYGRLMKIYSMVVFNGIWMAIGAYFLLRLLTG